MAHPLPSPCATDRIMHNLLACADRSSGNSIAVNCPLQQVYELVALARHFGPAVDWRFVQQQNALHRLTTALESHLLAAHRLLGLAWPLSSPPSLGARLHYLRCAAQFAARPLQWMGVPWGNLRSAFAWHRMQALHGDSGGPLRWRCRHLLQYLRERGSAPRSADCCACSETAIAGNSSCCVSGPAARIRGWIGKTDQARLNAPGLRPCSRLEATDCCLGRPARRRRRRCRNRYCRHRSLPTTTRCHCPTRNRIVPRRTGQQERHRGGRNDGEFHRISLEIDVELPAVLDFSRMSTTSPVSVHQRRRKCRRWKYGRHLQVVTFRRPCGAREERREGRRGCCR